MLKSWFQFAYLFLLWLSSALVSAQPVIINWGLPESVVLPAAYTKLNFEGAHFSEEFLGIPFWVEWKDIPAGTIQVSAEIINPLYGPVTEPEDKQLQKVFSEREIPAIMSSVTTERKASKSYIRIFPYRLSGSTGKFEKLLSFTLNHQPGAVRAKAGGPSLFATTSVLATGEWFKVGVFRDGMYKLTYHVLKQMGWDTLVSTQQVKLFGNGGSMVPQANAASRPDDLMENAVMVTDDNNNGLFDGSDGIIFYGQGPDRWKQDANTGRFYHIRHLYSDTVYYFASYGAGQGKRVTQNFFSGSSTETVTTFDGLYLHETDKYNLIKSGSEWYGESFEIQTSRIFEMNVPNIVSGSLAYLKADMISKSTLPNTFSISVNGAQVMTLVGKLATGDYTSPYAYKALNAGSTDTANFTAGNDNIQVGIVFSKPNSPSSGWLNFLELNVRQKLVLNGSSLFFRDRNSVGPGKVPEYLVEGTDAQTMVWDVTIPYNASAMPVTMAGPGVLRFVSPSEQLMEFAVFKPSGWLSPVPLGRVANQNLHGLAQADMLIISHPKFWKEAQRIADFHHQQDLLDVTMVSPEQIFNEFSSGAQDVSAIRDFIRMFYERAVGTDDLPRYVLLLGDASYDPKHRLSSNTNFVCTCESGNSLSPTSSYVTDDFFVQLDQNEGNCYSGGSDLPDVAIGRIPVRTPEEAKEVVDKILNYGSRDGVSLKDWRNQIVLVADDGDGNTHLRQSERQAEYLTKVYRNYNLYKIYFDAYKMVSTAGGQRYPDVNQAINQRIEKGTLIINYTGHGGESGWAHERVLDFSMINHWKNFEKLPLFFTATCEFSRFDDPAYTSAGELVLLNGNGAACALMTTTRLVFSSNNDVLNTNFFKNAFKTGADGQAQALGEIFRKTKVASGPLTDNRNFTLLGDPALKLYHPKHQVVTTHIQGNQVAQEHSVKIEDIHSGMKVADLFSRRDTVRALSKVTVRGEMRDADGKKLTGFNGVVYPTVFDKSDTVSTLSNKPSESPKTAFSFRRNIIYKGKASVKNGEFSFTFIVPKDINYQYGQGRISYYAENGAEDGAGNFEDFVIGGVDPNAAQDLAGPKIRLFMNDTRFANGGMTDENPKLLAQVFDSSGINTTGTGIGHDISATLDRNSSEVNILNDYYESDLDSYQSGSVLFPFSSLSPGLHTVSFKVWDVYNNSSEQEITFFVTPSEEFALSHVLNYPNPFSTRTDFHFEHNRPGMPLKAQVQIFTVTGKLVKTIESAIFSSGYNSGPITWDARDDYGDYLGKGVYIYKVRVNSGDGKYADKLEKLVILN